MDVEAVFEQVKRAQEAATVPQNEKSLAGVVNDDPSVAITVFPTFVNIEEEMVVDVISRGLREEILFVSMNLLFGAAGAQYSIRPRRSWVTNILTIFETDPYPNLNGEVLRAHIVGVGFRNEDNPLGLRGGAFITASFRLRVIWKGS